MPLHKEAIWKSYLPKRHRAELSRLFTCPLRAKELKAHRKLSMRSQYVSPIRMSRKLLASIDYDWHQQYWVGWLISMMGVLVFACFSWFVLLYSKGLRTKTSPQYIHLVWRLLFIRLQRVHSITLVFFFFPSKVPSWRSICVTRSIRSTSSKFSFSRTISHKASHTSSSLSTLACKSLTTDLVSVSLFECSENSLW